MGEGLALEAEKELCNPLCYNTEKLIHIKLIEDCLENLAKIWSVIKKSHKLSKLSNHKYPQYDSVINYEL